jgi:hypothetical protein
MCIVDFNEIFRYEILRTDREVNVDDSPGERRLKLVCTSIAATSYF